MSPSAELLYADFPREYASTRRILERYPDGQGDWRPHEKSRTLAALATHVAGVLRVGVELLTTDGLDVAGRTPPPPLDTAHELIELFDAVVGRFTALLDTVDSDALDQVWTLRHGQRVMVEQPRRVLLRTVGMNHLVHHRAQLGVYYRLLNVPVPGVYGPSADDVL